VGDPTFSGTLEPVAMVPGGADAANAWLRARFPVSRWRQVARRTIAEVVSVVVDALGGLPADILERVDAAYPFGERKYRPYKEWLKERKLFIEAIRAPVSMPTADEIAACEVARDAIEEGRDPATVAALLDQAPNRLARKCGACGALAGRACMDLDQPPEDANAGLLTTGEARLLARTIPVPHHARLVGHLDSGPLFTARSA